MEPEELKVGQVWRGPNHCHVEITGVASCGGFVYRMTDADESTYEDTIRRWGLANFLTGWTLQTPPKPEPKFRAGQVWHGREQEGFVVVAETDGNLFVVLDCEDGAVMLAHPNTLRGLVVERGASLSPESQAIEDAGASK